MLMSLLCFFFKQKTAYEMRISDWSSDVCSSDLQKALKHGEAEKRYFALLLGKWRGEDREVDAALVKRSLAGDRRVQVDEEDGKPSKRSEEHTSELQSLMRISYAVFCLKKKKKHTNNK